MEQKRIKVRLTENSPYSEYGYYKKGDIGYIDGYVNGCAVIILENGKFAKAELRWIEVVNAEDKNTNTELKESGDEKTIKEIKQFIRSRGMSLAQSKVDSWLAWLEKQGEQNLIKTPKFKSGDTIKFNGLGYNKYTIKEVCGISHYINSNGGRMDMSYTDANFELVEQKPVLDVEIPFGAKDSDLKEVTYDISKGYHAEIEDNKVVIKKGEKKPVEWSEEDEKRLSDIIVFVSGYATKEVNKEWVDFLKSLKERVQPKQEWSEEDRDLIEEIISHYRHLIAIGSLDSERYKSYIIPKLKSLRPQSKWKPSEEQIDAIRYVANFDYGGYKSVLVSLYEQLKAL